VSENHYGYELKFTFPSTLEEDEAMGWFETILSSLPEGAEGVIERPVKAIDMYELSVLHVGRTVRFNGITGKLEQVIESWGTMPAKVMVIDGLSHLVGQFDVVELIS
jgi:hypothetical protein